MGWRDRLRRRAATPAAAAPARGAPGTPGAAAPDAPEPSVPGDWDGGWRSTAAPELTVSRAPLGVSDGLAFRAGLAAWQNPSFDSGLGHALLTAAPAGLVRGVTRPAAPRATYTAGGPLLLRALRPEGVDGAEDVVSDGATADGTPEIARRPVPGERKSGSTGSRSGSSAVRPAGGDAGGDTRAGLTSSGDAAPRSRGLTAADSPAVLSASPAAVQRAVEPGTSTVVAPADTGRQPVAARTPLVRRVAVVPPAAADGTAARPASEPNPGRASATRGASRGRTPSGPAVRRADTEATGPHPEPSRTSGADGSHAAVRPSPSGPRLTVARRPAGPVRRVAAVRPATPPAPTPDASGTTTPASTSADSPAHVQRAATPSRGRAPLGAALSELPSTATLLRRDTPALGAGSAPGPTLPVVQRQGDTSVPYDSGTSATKGTASAAPADAPRRTPAPDGSGARARGGLGAPLPELPPSAALPGSAASPAPRATRTGPGPDVQRAPGADAPLLGTADVQRSLAEHSTTGGTTTGATPVAHGNGPATPLVTTSPAVAPDRPEPVNAVATEGAAAAGKAPVGASAGGPGSGGSRADGPTSGSHRADGPRSGGQRPRRPAVPGPVVVARAVAPGTAGIRPAGSADPRPLTVTGSAAHSATAADPRTLSLLAARPLTLSSRTPEGAAPPTAARSGGRPVVAARWPGAPAAAQGDTAPPTGTPAHRVGPSAVSPAASPGGSGTPKRPLPGPSAPAPATPQLQRAATAHSEPQGTRGTQGAPGKEAGVRTSGSPAPVQRVPVVRPAPPRPVTAGAATAVPAKPLPVTAPQAPPLADRPAGVPAPVGPVPVVRPRTIAPGSANPVQRDVAASAGADPLKGVQVKEVPARGRARSSSAPTASTSASTSTSGKAASRRRPESPQDDPGLDLDDLARRLIDPVSRLLRTELRRGRERTGRPYDGRR
ncbi:hypothetical protein J7E88_25940 [Streptomyces sp. ISL-10]|uniref:hypothetical protein n=1 Tax=Streptomyces sp. ISL-10 TaxID=2819172 RepID=UPI001BE9AF95|nr:hypothetical protein [Streptomyces sp. ISL-10]MBT2368680.1 hypothetical protein [Streptomyces sp. ISL-10]